MCGHGLTSRPLEASSTGFWMNCSFSLATQLGPVSLLLMVRSGCGTVLLILPIGRLLAALVSFRNIGEGGRKRIRLSKKTMSVNVLGLILGSSQFPNDGRLTLSGMLLFVSRKRGSFVLGLCCLTLVSPRELAEHQVAQSHAFRVQCMQGLFQ